MDGYAICMDRNEKFQNIEQHARDQSALIRRLENCVPEGSTIVGMVIRAGSQIQRTPLALVT